MWWDRIDLREVGTVVWWWDGGEIGTERRGNVRKDTGKKVDGRSGAGGGKERGSFERVGWGGVRGEMGEGRKLGSSDSLVGIVAWPAEGWARKMNKPNYGVINENYHAASNVIKWKGRLKERKSVRLWERLDAKTEWMESTINFRRV
jgi:hypothetical protein